MTRTLGLLLIVTTLGLGTTRADDTAPVLQAHLAVNRARAALFGFRSGEVARDVDAAARRGSFLACLDDAGSHVRALPAGPGRTEVGDALNRVVIDATFATCLSTEGRGRRHRLLTPGEACERLDREAIGPSRVRAIERALLAVHAVAARSYPPSGWARGDVASAKELFRELVASFDEATAALRVLIHGRRPYVEALAPHLERAVQKVRGLQIRGGGFAGVGGEARPLRDVGTVVDEAYLDARTPPFAAVESSLIQVAGLPSRARPGDVLGATVRVTSPATVRIDVELIDSTGVQRGLRVHRVDGSASSSSFRLSLPVAAETRPGQARLLVSVLSRDGSVHTSAALLLVEAPAAAPTPPAIGLLGAVERVGEPSAKVEVLELGRTRDGRRDLLSARVRLVSPDRRIVGWEARVVSDAGGTHSLEAARCDGHEVEVTTLLREPTETGEYRVVVVMKLADGTETAPFVVSRLVISPAGSP